MYRFQRDRKRKCDGTTPRAELSEGRRKRCMLRCVRGWWNAKIVSCGRTSSVSNVGGGTPIESLNCGRAPGKAVSMVGRRKKIKTYGDTPLCLSEVQ